MFSVRHSAIEIKGDLTRAEMGKFVQKTLAEICTDARPLGTPGSWPPASGFPSPPSMAMPVCSADVNLNFFMSKVEKKIQCSKI
jgi:hypothetical protein